MIYKYKIKKRKEYFDCKLEKIKNILNQNKTEIQYIKLHIIKIN